MLLETQQISENKYALKCSFEGKRYADALINYPSYIDSDFADFFENDLFPEGKTPVVVNEKSHGDDLYRYVLIGNFDWLYQEAVKTARLEDGHLESVDIGYFSSERTLFTLIISTQGNLESGTDHTPPVTILTNTLDKISNVDKLRIFSKEKRDTSFWQYMQDCCLSYQQMLSKEIVPILMKIGVINAYGDGIGVDLSSKNPLQPIYPLIELGFYPYAVLNAALHEYLDGFSKEDEANMDKYIFSLISETSKRYTQTGGDGHILLDRIREFSRACKEELLSGYSLYGHLGVDFEGLKGWSQSHQVKCAHLFCDHIAYIEHFGELCSYEDLDKLRPIVVSNTPKKLKSYADLFDKLYTTSIAIFRDVRGMLNGSTKILWKAEGLCQHCGSEFKRGLFGTKCTNCKSKKDY